MAVSSTQNRQLMQRRMCIRITEVVFMSFFGIFKEENVVFGIFLQYKRTRIYSVKLRIFV